MSAPPSQGSKNLFLVPSLAVCQILPKGVVSVIGPASSPASVSTISHICGEKEVSHTPRDGERGETPPLPVCLRLSLVSFSALHSAHFPITDSIIIVVVREARIFDL